MKTWCCSKLLLIHAMHNLYIHLLITIFTFPHMLDIPQCLVWFGLVLVVRKYESNASLMSEIIVHMVPGTSVDKSQEYRKVGARKGKEKNKVPRLNFWFIFCPISDSQRKKMCPLHSLISTVEEEWVSSFDLDVVQKQLPSRSFGLPMWIHALCRVFWL